MKYGYFFPLGILSILLANIIPATPISAPHYSDSVSWRSKNSRKMTVAQIIRRNATSIFTHIVEYGYFGHIEPLIFFFVNIGPDIQIYISRDLYSVSW